MKKYQYCIYPLAVVIFVLILSILRLHGGSMGFYNVILNGNTKIDGHIYGEPRAVRSDEYIVSTPLLISQDINNEPVINENVGTGINFGINYDKPSRTFFNIFKPSQWIFFTSNNYEFNFAFYWWIKYAIMLIGVYLLVLKLTKKNLFLSISTSLLFFFTPFVQWWLPLELIGLISFALFFFLNIIDEERLKYSILYTLGFTYFLISFGLILYPPFQISLAWVALFLGLGYMVKRRKEIFKGKNFLRIVLSLLLAGGLTALTGYLFYIQFQDIIKITTNTVYPGTRFLSAGQGSFTWLLNGFLNILLQKTNNGIHSGIGNQSEASNFLLVSLFFTPWIIYKNALQIKKKKVFDWISIFLLLGLSLLVSWYILPLPDWFSKATLLYMVLPQRIFIGIGYASYILIPIFLNNRIYKFNKKKIFDILVISLSILFALTVFLFITLDIYISDQPFFTYPLFFPPILKAIGAILIAPSLLFLVLINKKKLFYIGLLLYGFISTFMINPLYRGLGILTETRIARAIREYENDGKWVVYDDYRWAQYILLNGGNPLNGTHFYPLFEIWEVLDPDEEYIHIYNRYANVAVSEYEEGDDLVILNHPDTITINIDPCDTKLKQLNVKYILSKELMEVSCGTLEKDIHYPGPSFYIYKLDENR
jgi:hypothetical protein